MMKNPKLKNVSSTKRSYLFALLLSLSIMVNNVHATCLPAWTYEATLTITTAPAVLPLTNYWVSFTTNTQALITAGYLQANGNDLRFSDNSCTPLQYWIESGINTTTTLIWIRVPSITSASTQIKMSYGNSIAVAGQTLPAYVNSYNVISGPAWGGNPPTYTGLEAAALLYGSSPNDYLSSVNGISNLTISRTANESIWGISGCTVYAEKFKVNTTYNCGSSNCATSAYVNDNCSGTNYVFNLPNINFRVTPEPTICAAPIVGLTVSPSATVCAGTSVTLTGTGASTYSWSNGVVNGVPFVPASTTTYTLTGTDLSSCSATITQLITVNPLPTVTANTTASAVCAGTSVTLTGGGATTYTWTGLVTNGVGFIPVSTATYTVTGTNSNGCTNTASVTVTVNPLPTVSANTTTSAVCAGNSVTLTGGGASTYAWSGGVTNAVSFVPVSTTTYTVTGTGANSCTNTATVTVTVNPLPTVTANTTATAVCAGNSVTLTGGGASTYTWTGLVTNGVGFIPASTATYTVTGTNVNGCVNTASVTVSVNPLPTVTANSTANVVCAGNPVTLTGGGATSYTWTGLVTDGVGFVPAASATYTVTGTDANSCTNTATITISVNPLPTIVASANDSSICQNQSAVLSAIGGNTYLWNPGNIVGAVTTVIPVATTTYSVTGTDLNGCNGTGLVTINVNPLPTVTGTAASSVVCLNDAAVALTGTPIGGAWTGTGVSASNFDPSVSGLGTFQLVYSYGDVNGCSSTATVGITVNACTGILVQSLENGITVFPNPNNGKFILNSPITNGEILICDVLGEIVFSSTISNPISTIDLSAKANGIYFITVKTDKESFTQKIVIQK